MCSDKTWPLNRLQFGPPIPQSEFLWFAVIKIASVSSEIDHWAGGNSPPNSSIGIFEPPCAQCTVVKQGHKNVQWQNLTTESTVVKQGHTMCSDKTWPRDRPKFHPHFEYMRSTALKNHDFSFILWHQKSLTSTWVNFHQHFQLNRVSTYQTCNASNTLTYHSKIHSGQIGHSNPSLKKDKS